MKTFVVYTKVKFVEKEYSGTWVVKAESEGDVKAQLTKIPSIVKINRILEVSDPYLVCGQ